MCPLRYILIILSVGFALFVVIGGAAYAPEFIVEAEQKRKKVNISLLNRDQCQDAIYIYIF